MSATNWMVLRMRGIFKSRTQAALLLLAVILVASLGVAYFYASDQAPRFASLSEGDRVISLDARLGALEKRQSEQFKQLSSQLAALSMRNGRAKPSPEQIRERERRHEHSRRMQEDPAYARRMQEQRLASLQNQFSREPMDHRWATETGAFTRDALASAAARAGAKFMRSDVDCRSNTCRMVLDIDARFNYEDVATYLMTDLAELLPGAQFVVMPLKNGVRTVNIFASRESAQAREYEGD